MAEGSTDRADARVDRAIEALRAEPVPAGPPSAVLDRVIAAGAAEPPRRARWFRPRFWLQAAAVIVLGAAVGAILLATGGGGRAAWADVQQHIRSARTASFTLTLEGPGGPEMVMRCMFNGPGRLRQEVLSPQRMVSIMDVTRGKVLILEPDSGRAIIGSIGILPADQIPTDRLSHIKHLIELSHTELGRRTIDGREARGYRVGSDGEQVSIWADAATGMPLRMEWTILAGGTRNILTDFRFNEPMNEADFGFDVPEGYTVVPIDMTNPALADVSVLLRIWAQARGGTFPDSLSGPQFQQDVGNIERDWPTERLRTEGSAVSRAFIYLAIHRQVRYVGTGVALGEADRPILIEPPKHRGAKGRAIFGDLRIREWTESPAASQ